MVHIMMQCCVLGVHGCEEHTGTSLASRQHHVLIGPVALHLESNSKLRVQYVKSPKPCESVEFRHSAHLPISALLVQMSSGSKLQVLHPLQLSCIIHR